MGTRRVEAVRTLSAAGYGDVQRSFSRSRCAQMLPWDPLGRPAPFAASPSPLSPLALELVRRGWVLREGAAPQSLRNAALRLWSPQLFQ